MLVILYYLNIILLTDNKILLSNQSELLENKIRKPIGVMERNSTLWNEFYTAKNQTLLIGYITGSEFGPSKNSAKSRLGSKISGAITLAVDEINRQFDILPDHNLDFIIAETYCELLISIKKMASLTLKNVDAIIGPQESCINEAMIADAFNIPTISYACTQMVPSSLTFSRTKHTDSTIASAVVSFLLNFNWKKIAFIHKDTKVDEPSHYALKTIKQLFEKNNIEIIQESDYKSPYYYIDKRSPKEYTSNTTGLNNSFVEFVEQTYKRARIYVMFGEPYEFVGLTMALFKRGLTNTGEYYIIGIAGDNKYMNSPKIYFEGILLRNQITPTDDIVKSFSIFTCITTKNPDDSVWKSFSHKVNHYLGVYPFFFINPHNREKNIIPDAAYLYDAVKLYAKAADEQLKNGKSPSNGREIKDRLRNSLYLSKTGYLTKMDSNGNAQGNFTILTRHCQNESNNPRNEMKTCLDFTMRPVGYFLIDKNDDLPKVSFYRGRAIKFIDHSKKWPVDEPICGFQNEKCRINNKLTKSKQILFSISGGIILVGLLFGYFFFKKHRYEKQLESLMWKIDIKDITGRQRQLADSVGGGVVAGGGEKDSLTSNSSYFEMRQTFTETGKYKGTIVAIKFLTKRTVDLTRNVRKELKIIRELRHDNISQFIGAGAGPNQVYIITEYCSRGSIKDILASENVKLEDIFLASMIFDIIKGMIYIHDSEMRVHGNLKASNCLVDSRWVVKLTDFGLKEFKHVEQSDMKEKDESYYEGLLYMAPEMLRILLSNANNSFQPTQKSDSYSFGIVLYEIYARDGPFGKIDYPAEEIIGHVASNVDSEFIFRPKLSAIDQIAPIYAQDCMMDCWKEEANYRPDFKTIRIKLKQLQHGMKSNIFDNMISIMQLHATNLEDIVDQRTLLLKEEKKKTDELLHQMLPQSVAEQLKHNQPVRAESFDSVTIYFSDICGFTELSSKSSPMQIVDLLNELYTQFDSIIENFDVYKVETIGDAYMVVSGLPEPSKKPYHHATEIASMSLQLLESMKTFKIPHRPNDTIKLRIGLHSGPCVAGVVGKKMPRYCLFGDTVNTASRMESNGEPLKIHTSFACYQLLEKNGSFICQKRGNIYVKGKGHMDTYWVIDQEEAAKKERVDKLKEIEEYRKKERNIRNSCSLRRSSSRKSNMNKSPKQLQKQQYLVVNKDFNQFSIST